MVVWQHQNRMKDQNMNAHRRSNAKHSRLKSRYSGIWYQSQDKKFVNYQQYQLDGRFYFRGPKPDLSRPYICFIGSAHTLGRFCTSPFAQQVANHFGRECLNLGHGGADPTFFLDNDLLRYANRAEWTIVQVMSARSSGNSMFQSDHGTRHGFASGERTVADAIWNNESTDLQANELRRLLQESQANYVANMRTLLSKLKSKTLLVYFSKFRPQPEQQQEASCLQGGKAVGQFPHFVTAEMIERFSSRVPFLEIVTQAGSPQLLPNGRRDFYYPSPEMHSVAAENIIEFLEKEPT